MGKRQGGKLNEEQQTFLVTAIACFDGPKIVAEAIKKEFGVTITPQAVEKYDPTKRAGRNLHVKWRKLFEETRKRFLQDSSDVPVAHRAYRLRTLQRMVDTAETKGNYPLAAQLLEQAAKEVGDAYTNRQKHELTGKDGKDLPPAPAPVNIFQLPDNGRA